MKRYITEKAIDGVIQLYRHAREEEAKSTTNFNAEYWKGKHFAIIDTFSVLTEMQWPAAETLLSRRAYPRNE